MAATSSKAEAVARLISDAQTVAVCSHVNPDGDTLGCAAAMGIALKRLGKNISLFCDGKVPDQLLFLPGISEMRIPDGSEGPFDLTLCVDVSDPKRMGACSELITKSMHTAQIDHHPTNPMFAEENWVDGDAPAACLMIREMLHLLDVELDTDLAVCLYTGVSTDTGNFAFATTNAACFRLMSELMGYRLPLAKLNRILFRERALPQVLLLGRALNGIRYYENGRIAVMTLTRADFAECGALGEHADTLVNFGLDTVGTRMALLAREALEGEGKDGTIKFSLRAKEPDTVSDIAQHFGGGGHPQAAGITMSGTIKDTVQEVVEAMTWKLNG